MNPQITLAAGSYASAPQDLSCGAHGGPAHAMAAHERCQNFCTILGTFVSRNFQQAVRGGARPPEPVRTTWHRKKLRTSRSAQSQFRVVSRTTFDHRHGSWGAVPQNRRSRDFHYRAESSHFDPTSRPLRRQRVLRQAQNAPFDFAPGPEVVQRAASSRERVEARRA
jgi:hypothetical protein